MNNIASAAENPPLDLARVFRTWWPLAASWVLMLAELPFQSAVIARLPDPAINLAAYGGIVMPIVYTVEAPVVMLLAASTSLCRDWASYVKLRRFVMVLGVSLVAIHALIAFTPLYYFVVNTVIKPPAEIVEPARWGLMILTPFSWSIGYRRFNQGVLIRYGHSRAIGVGTVIRVLADILVLVVLAVFTDMPGLAVASTAMTVGLFTEAIFIRIAVHPVLTQQLRWEPPVSPALNIHSFLAFFLPLAMTEMLGVLVEPALSAAISRMPDPLNSLATWPVLYGLVWVLFSGGMAFVEVVIALLDQPRALPVLRRFSAILLVGTFSMTLLFAATPLGRIWFGDLSGLPPPLVEMARRALWLALPAPCFAVLLGWFQGQIVFSHRTRGITEAIVAFMLLGGAILVAGTVWGQISGLYVGMLAITIGDGARVIWLWRRSRESQRLIQAASSPPARNL